MKLTIAFIRILFVLITTFLLTSYTITTSGEGLTAANLLIGMSAAAVSALCIFGVDQLLGRYSLRAFNIAALGIFFGYLMGQVLLLLLKTAVEAGSLPIEGPTFHLVSVLVMLASIYLGMILTARSAEELSVSIPFVRFKAMIEKKKDVLIDASILNDTRVLDLASSGLLDHLLVLPRFVLVDLQGQAESADEGMKSRARRCLDVVKKLEGISSLGLRYTDTDFPEAKEAMLKLVRLARLLDANILTADINRIQQSDIEGVRVINIHTLANLLKPIMQTGEYITIKIQRYGKEARQGVGYLEDGTMVVVNGAADFIGETIRARVLSVKHTSSGRMIFCNASDEVNGSLGIPDPVSCQEELAASTKKYFAH